MVICGKVDVVYEDLLGLVIYLLIRLILVLLVIQLCFYVWVFYCVWVLMIWVVFMYWDWFCCVYCGGKVDIVDYVVFCSWGGVYFWENCVVCCLLCNYCKGDRLLIEFGWVFCWVLLLFMGLYW